MKTCPSPSNPVHKPILAIGAVLLTLAAACSSPTSPAATDAAFRSSVSPAAHTACGVVAGSSQC
jgi:hypothetical protein